jgi:hypothetical protein
VCSFPAGIFVISERAAYDELSIARYLNDSPVEQSSAVQIMQQTADNKKEVEATLTLRAVSLDDSAIVKAVATNVAGKADTTAKLDVKSKYSNLTHVQIPTKEICGEMQQCTFVYSQAPHPRDLNPTQTQASHYYNDCAFKVVILFNAKLRCSRRIIRFANLFTKKFTIFIGLLFEICNDARD